MKVYKRFCGSKEGACNFESIKENILEHYQVFVNWEGKELFPLISEFYSVFIIGIIVRDFLS